MKLFLMIVLTAGSLFMIVYSLIAERVSEKLHLQYRLAGPKGKWAGPQAETKAASAVNLKALAPALAKLVKPKSAREQVRLKIKLANAGHRSSDALVFFLVSKIAMGFGLMVLFLFLTGLGGKGLPVIFGAGAVGVGVGFMLPDLWLHYAIKSRQEKITYSLPDCLDLLVICVESGLGLEAAMSRVSQEMVRTHPELAEEFLLTQQETRLGISRSEALANLATRIGTSEVKSLTGFFIQTEKFGTSIAKTLRIYARAVRLKRRQKAEERAGKTAVKLVLPLVLFILPATFVVLVGPAVYRLINAFASMSLGRPGG